MKYFSHLTLYRKPRQHKTLSECEERLDKILDIVDKALVKIKEAIELDIRSLRGQISTIKVRFAKSNHYRTLIWGGKMKQFYQYLNRSVIFLILLLLFLLSTLVIVS